MNRIIAGAGVDRVIACAARDRIRPRTDGADEIINEVIAIAAINGVVTCPAQQRVIARAARDQVISSATVDGISPATADDRVIAAPSREGQAAVVGRSIDAVGLIAANHAFDIVEGDGVRARTGSAIFGTREGDVDAARGDRREIERVEIRPGIAAPDRVTAPAVVEFERILTALAVERVVACPARDRVIVIAAVEQVVAIAARDAVGPGLAIDGIIAVIDVDRVVARAALDAVVVLTAGDAVGIRRVVINIAERAIGWPAAARIRIVGDLIGHARLKRMVAHITDHGVADIDLIDRDLAAGGIGERGGIAQTDRARGNRIARRILDHAGLVGIELIARTAVEGAVVVGNDDLPRIGRGSIGRL